MKISQFCDQHKASWSMWYRQVLAWRELRPLHSGLLVRLLKPCGLPQWHVENQGLWDSLAHQHSIKYLCKIPLYMKVGFLLD